jgi:hypothetical protein
MAARWSRGSIIHHRCESNSDSDFVSASGLVAADTELSLRATTVIAALVGLLHGYLNGAGMGSPELGLWLSSALCLWFLFSWLSAPR